MSTDGDADGETTRITRKGQVTIPKRFREEFGLKEGDELLWEEDRGRYHGAKGDAVGGPRNARRRRRPGSET